MMKNKFGKRISIEQVEEGNSLMPKFDEVVSTIEKMQ